MRIDEFNGYMTGYCDLCEQRSYDLVPVRGNLQVTQVPFRPMGEMALQEVVTMVCPACAGLEPGDFMRRWATVHPPAANESTLA